MAAQEARLQADGPSPRNVPLAIQLLCLVWAAFIMVENVGEFLWNWPTDGIYAGGTLGLKSQMTGGGYVRVLSVAADGATARAGVRVGDRIMFDRRYDPSRRLHVGEPVGLTLVRGMRTTHLQILAAPHKETPHDAEILLPATLYFFATAIGALFGAFIIWRSRRNATTLLLGLGILSYGLANIAPPLWASGPRIFPFVYGLNVINLTWIPVLFYAFAAGFYRDCVGPGKPWERIAFWAYALVMAATGLGIARQVFTSNRFPFVGNVETFGVLVSYLGFAACFAYLFLGWRRSSAAVQQRYAIMLVATVAIILAQALDYLTSAIPGAGASTAHFLANTVLTAVIAYPLFAYAILRHKVFDLGFAVNRTLVYGAVSAILLAAFGLIEWLVDHFAPIQGREKNALVDAAIALGVFLVFHRVRDLVEHGVEGLFFRSWQKAEASLRRFVRDAAFVRSSEALARSFAAALSRFAEDAPAALYVVGKDGRPRLAAATTAAAPGLLEPDDPALVALRAEPKPLEPDSAGSALAAALIAPMVNRNEVFGLVLLGLKPNGLAYRPDEKDLIGWATRQVGLDLHALKVEQLEADKADLSKTVAVLEHALSLSSATASA